MGVNVNGQLCFGILFPSDFEFPWMDDKWDVDEDINNWWRIINGFVPTNYPWNEQGNLKAGATEEDEDDYIEEQNKWDKEHPPIPIQLVTDGVPDEETTIIALKEPYFGNGWGNPIEIDPDLLVAESNVLLDFCNRFDIKMPKLPRWWLSSYKG